MPNHRILLDIEMQHDFFCLGGALYRRRSPKVARRIFQLFDWVRREGLSVMSTVLRVRPTEQGPFSWLPHCVEGTAGEQKVGKTVLPSRIDLGLRNSTDLPADLFDTYQQVIFEKRHTDVFRHARAERLLSELPPTTFIVCGAGVSHGIAQAVIGLRARGFSVIVAADALLDLHEPDAEMACERMNAKGALFVPTAKIMRRAPSRLAPAPRRAMSRR